MSIELLKQDIKNKNLRKVYLFCGPEEYLKKYYADVIEKMLVRDDFKTMNSIRIEGKVELNKLIEASETLPFFADRKMILVRNSGFFKREQKGERKKTSAEADLSDIVANLPQYNCIIFYEEEIDKRLKAVDAVKKNGLLVEFLYQKPAGLLKWVIKIFNASGKNIDPTAASKLVENCEQGMNQILNEANKVIMYTGTRKRVVMQDIEDACVKSIKSRIFDLTDALAEGYPVKALKVLDDLVILKEPMPKILFMIGKHFRQVLEAKCLHKEGYNTDQIASKMGITSYGAVKIIRQTNLFAEHVLRNAIEESLQYDVDVKTGKINDRIAVEMLIAAYSKRAGA